MFSKKRGLNQVDWAISLGIFLIYIAWFFIIIRPVVDQNMDAMPLSNIIKEDLNNEIAWQIEKTPIFIKSSYNLTDHPIFLNFTPAYGENKFSMLNDKEYFYYDNKIMVIADANDFFWIVESNATYNKTDYYFDIVKNADTVSTGKNLSIKFNSSLADEFTYKNIEYISNTEYYINNIDMPTLSFNYTDYDILVQYLTVTQPFKLYQRLIAKNSVLWNYIEKSDLNSKKRFTINFSLNNIDHYFFDNNKNGDASDCVSCTNDYLKLYDNANSLHFIMPANTSFSLCNDTLNITILIDDTKEFFIVFDNINYTKGQFNDYRTIRGLSKNIEGISYDKLLSLDYSKKIRDWSDFKRQIQISIYNQSLNDNNTDKILDIGNNPATTNNIYANEYRDYFLDQYGNKDEVVISVKTW